MEPNGRLLRLIAMIAYPTDSYGLIRRSALLETGVSDNQIAQAIRRGLLLRVYPGSLVVPSTDFDGAEARSLDAITGATLASTAWPPFASGVVPFLVPYPTRDRVLAARCASVRVSTDCELYPLDVSTLTVGAALPERSFRDSIAAAACALLGCRGKNDASPFVGTYTRPGFFSGSTARLTITPGGMAMEQRGRRAAGRGERALCRAGAEGRCRGAQRRDDRARLDL